MIMDWEDFLGKVIIKEVDVEDKLTINSEGKLEDVRYYNIVAQPKATLEYVEVEFTLTKTGIK